MYLTSGVKLHIHLLNVVVQFIVFLTLSILIFRGTDISKYFSESLGIRDNESQLYIKKVVKWTFKFYDKYINPFKTRPIKGTMANSVDPNQMLQNVASDQDLHCLH